MSIAILRGKYCPLSVQIYIYECANWSEQVWPRANDIAHVNNMIMQVRKQEGFDTKRFLSLHFKDFCEYSQCLKMRCIIVGVFPSLLHIMSLFIYMNCSILPKNDFNVYENYSLRYVAVIQENFQSVTLLHCASNIKNEHSFGFHFDNGICTVYSSLTQIQDCDAGDVTLSNVYLQQNIGLLFSTPCSEWVYS